MQNVLLTAPLYQFHHIRRRGPDRNAGESFPVFTQPRDTERSAAPFMATSQNSVMCTRRLILRDDPCFQKLLRADKYSISQHNRPLCATQTPGVSAVIVATVNYAIRWPVCLCNMTAIHTGCPLAIRLLFTEIMGARLAHAHCM